MRIVHVIPFLSENMSGTEKALHNMISFQKRQKHDVEVVTTDLMSAKGERKSHEDQYVVRLPAFASWNRVPITPSFGRHLNDEARDANIIHAHIFRSIQTFHASKVAIRNGIPLVLHPHGTAGTGVRYRALKWVWDKTFGASILDSATVALAISERERLELIRAGLPSEKIRTLPLWLSSSDDDIIRNMLAAVQGHKLHQEENRTQTVLYMGQIDPIKGLDVLVRAFRRVLDTSPGTTLLIAGDGDQREKLRINKIIEKLGIRGNVRFLGFVESPRKYDILATSDAVVIPSYSESGPLIAIEAAACGCRTIVSNNCGSSEWASEAGGVVFESGNVSDCSEKILMMLREDPAVGNQRRTDARNYYLCNFTEDIVLQGLERIYEDANRTPKK